MGAAIDMRQNYWNELERERDGYILRNEKTGVVLSCTENFLELWMKRGFSIVEKGSVTLTRTDVEKGPKL